MRLRTVLAIAVVVVLLGGAAVLGLSQEARSGGQLSEEWTSDTATGISGNHHSPAAGVVDGTPMVFAPISGEGDTEQCRLAGLYAANGSTRWRYDVSPANCELHAVADPTLADIDDDGTAEVLAATTEETVSAHDPHTGAVEFRHDLTSYGYTQPVVAYLGDDGTLEIVVVDVRGTVIVVGADGTERWRDRLDSFTWGQPAVRDFDGDGTLEIAVGLESGAVRLYGPDGDVEWARPNATASSITWMTTVGGGGVATNGETTDDGGEAGGGETHIDGENRSGSENRSGTGIVVATVDGTVARLDGPDGATRWERDFGDFAAVHAVGDGDGDGTQEVYATARDGVLRSLDARTGEAEWTTTLTTEDVQMMPPPSVADLDGDGEAELLAVSNAGDVSVVDPGSGEVLATAGRDVPIFTHPTLADTDGDGAAEAYVIFGDGRVVKYSYEGN